MLQKIKAEEIMRPVPAELSPEDSAHRVNRLMEDHNACHLPVTVNSQLLGLVSRVEALAARLFKGPGYLVALDFMKTNPVKVYPGSTLGELTKTLFERQDDCLTVVSRHDEVLGAVHAHDILRHILPCQRAQGGNFLPIPA